MASDDKAYDLSEALRQSADALRQAAEAIVRAADSAKQGAPAGREDLTDSLMTTLEGLEGLAVRAVGPSGKILRWNAGSERTFGYSATEAIGSDFAGLLVGPGIQALTRDVIAMAFVSGQTPSDCQMRLVHRDGSSVTVLTNWTLVGAGEDRQLVMIDVNLTGLQHMQAGRQPHPDAAGTQKMAMIAELVGHLAHHYNNALAVIQGNAELLRMERPMDGDLLSLVDPILAAARRSAELTTQLMAYAEDGATFSQSVDVHGVIEAVAEDLLAEAGDDVRIVVQLRADSAVVAGGADELAAALGELGRNACQAVGDDGVVTIATETVRFDATDCPPQVRPGEYLCVSVRDTGRGMDAEALQRAFEPFYTTQPFGQGDGLGLTRVYGCLKRHRGAIHLISTPGQGAEVRVYLPLAVRGAPAEDILAPPEAPGTIMIVDEEPPARKALVAMLTEAEYDVRSFASGAEAIEYYGRHHDDVSLVIVDFNLPDMAGPETLKRLQETNGHVKAMLSGGFLMVRSAQAALESGVIAFLAKPYDPQQVLPLVAEFVGGD